MFSHGPRLTGGVDPAKVRAEADGELFQVKNVIPASPRFGREVIADGLPDRLVAEVVGPLLKLIVVGERVDHFGVDQVQPRQMFEDPRPLGILGGQVGVDSPDGQGHGEPVFDGRGIVEDEPGVEIGQSGDQVLEGPLAGEHAKLRADPLATFEIGLHEVSEIVVGLGSELHNAISLSVAALW